MTRPGALATVAAFLAVGLALARTSAEGAPTAPPAMARFGILVGLRNHPDALSPDDARPEYRTVWVTPYVEGTRYEITLEGPGLLVPRQTGFWQVGVRRTGDRSGFVDDIWAKPAWRASAAAPAGNPPPARSGLPWAAVGSCRPSREQILTFVGVDHLSWTGRRVECADGRRVERPDIGTASFDAPFRDGVPERLPIAVLLGPSAQAALEEGARDYRERYLIAEDAPCGLGHAPSDRAWAIDREPGRWTVRGLVDASDPSCPGLIAPHFFFTAPLPVPMSLVGVQSANPLYELHRPKDQRYRFDLIAPAGDGVGLTVGGNDVANTGLGFFPVEDGRGYGSYPSVRLARTETPVMVFWAAPSDVERWTRTLRAVPGWGPPKPDY